MCGRYFLDVDFYELYQKIILHESEPRVVYKLGEILPTDAAPVILAPREQRTIRPMRWGLMGYEKNQRIINARRETLLQKPRFARLMAGQRCIVPATVFYEWEKQGRQRARHSFGQERSLLFAGLYEGAAGEEAFTIITMAASGAVARFHDRIPVALEAEALETWLDSQVREAEAYEVLLRQGPEYRLCDPEEQLRFL